MKKLILAAITLTTAASVFAQGTVGFNNRIVGTGTAHVYSGSSARTGNGPTDNPVGSTDWSGYLLIGTAGGLGGSNTFTQLLGANGAGAPESSLQPSSGGVTTFRTGAAAGTIQPTTSTFLNIPQDAAAASFEMAVWDNTTGLYPTWAQASSAVASGIIFGGHSAEFTLSNIGGTTFTPPNIVGVGGLTSFSIAIPEPTSVALAGLSAAALLIFRRRK